MQTSIPCLFMRGGTSRGPFFREADLPSDTAVRDRVLLAAMGSPDRRQIDGLGGAHPLTSKVGIVRPGTLPGVDLDFLFAQLQPDKDTVDTTPNCGNMLAAVVPFALESGLVVPRGETSTFRVLTLNTGMQCDITVPTPLGPDGRRHVEYEGEARIDGVPGTAAPISINFLDTAGSVCPGLLPTGNVRDTITVTGADLDDFSLRVQKQLSDLRSRIKMARNAAESIKISITNQRQGHPDSTPTGCSRSYRVNLTSSTTSEISLIYGIDTDDKDGLLVYLPSKEVSKDQARPIWDHIQL